MHAQRNRGAHRHCDGFVRNPARQIDRRFAGVGRRIGPRIQRRERCGLPERKRGGEARARVGAANDKTDSQQQQNGIAEKMRIVPCQRRVGDDPFEPVLPRQQRANMGAPQAFRQRIAGAGREAVVAFGNRAMGQSAVALEAARALVPAGRAKLREVLIEKISCAGERRDQEQRMQRDRQMHENIQQRQRQECARNAAGRPQLRPRSLPQNSEARERDAPLGAAIQAKAGVDRDQETHRRSFSAAPRSTGPRSPALRLRACAHCKPKPSPRHRRRR